MEESKCLSTFIKELWESKDDPITIFFGTGISITCGNMSADDTRETILDWIFQDNDLENKKEIFKAIMEQTGQFEDFLMRIFDDLNDKTLRTQFEEGLKKLYIVPNPKDSHAFLAELANKNRCSCYVTTNFDLHLEDQFGEDRLEVMVHEQLKKIKEIKYDKPVYLKIHGSVKKPRPNGALGMNIFLPNVSDSKIKQEINYALDYVFMNKNSSPKILFLGYSFSDVYDIVKWMNEKLRDEQQQFKSAGKKIYIVAHDTSSCQLFTEAKKYNKFICKCKKPTRDIPEFSNCLVFLGSTEKFVEKSLDYLSIGQLKPNGRICFEKYKNQSTIALKNFFQKLNDYDIYCNYYSLLLQHQLLYEVARCCVAANTCSAETDNKKIVMKCYDYAMIYIQKALNLIPALKINDVEKKYLICLNKRHQMILEILRGKVNKAKQIFKYIIDNLPESNRVYKLMKLRTVFDFVCNWYIAKISYDLEDIGPEYLQQLKIAADKLFEEIIIIVDQAATPYILTSLEAPHVSLFVKNKLAEPFFECQRIFVEEIYKKQNSKDDKSKPKCIECFDRIGRPEYVAISELIFGYLLKEENMISKARILYKNLGYNYGGYFQILCDKAGKSIRSSP